MKSLLLLLLCSSSICYASRARMYSLSQDPNRGSAYINDQRNIFGNAADINVYKNYMVGELLFESKEKRDNGEPEIALRPQGGFFTHIGEFPFGVYLGQYTLLQLYDYTLISTSTFMENFIGPGEADPINIFFGGNTGFQWGLSMRYAGDQQDKEMGESKYTGLGLGAGIRKGIFEIFLNWKIKEDSDYYQGSETAALNNNGINIGITVSHKHLTIFGEYTKDKMQPVGDLFGFPTGGSDTTIYFFGIGKVFNITPTLKLYSNLDYTHFTSKAPVNGQANSGKITTTQNLPLVIGAEYDATSWLTVQASVRQTIFFGNTDIENNIDTNLSVPPASTKVNMGATLKLGKFKIDGNLGMDESSFIDFSAFFANASLTYWY